LVRLVKQAPQSEFRWSYVLRELRRRFSAGAIIRWAVEKYKQ